MNPLLTSAMPFREFKIAIVRELAWACFAAPVMDSTQLLQATPDVANCGIALTPERMRWLKALDDQPQSLLAHMNQLRSPRLGLRFEHLWHFLLTEDPALDLVAHNLPVRENGRTLGEFDCLYYCHQRQQHYHLELAVKFFLSDRQNSQNGDHSQWHEWLGPDSKDRLDLKVEHLCHKQIRLSDLPAAIAELNKLGIDRPAREIEIKGHLFQARHDPLPAPLGFHQSSTLSHWVHCKDLASILSEGSDECYRLLSKPEWLGAKRREDHPDWMNAAQMTAWLQQHFQQGTRSQLLVAFDRRGCESRRFFLTADNRPIAI
jgi:hypothetical protein